MLIRTSLVAAAALTLAPAAAHARDGRIRSVFYEPDTIVAIVGRPDIQSTIVFSPDERIENVAIGDSAAWQVTPNKRANLLFVKPQQPRGRTNMTVITDQRTYLFDLVARPNGAPVVYTLQFTYPAAPPPPPPESVKTVEAATAPPAPVDLNFNWIEKGSKHLLPQCVFDDGEAVYLRWDEDKAMPALLTVAPDGTEGLVNYTVKGEFVVIEGPPGRLLLRVGKDVATLDRGRPQAPIFIPNINQTAER